MPDALGRGHLTEHHFERWSGDIEHVVRVLPLHRLCSPELYLSILERTVSTGGRVDVVERGGVPIAVIGSRHEGRLRWQNVMNWLIPGFVCAGAEDDLLAALARIRIEIAVAWWRMPSVPDHPAIREFHETPVHQISVQERETFWRSSSMWKTIARARNRCAALTLSINEPGDAQWIIESAGHKWSEPEPVTADKLDVARTLLRTGNYATFTLRDGGRPIAGSTIYLDGDTAVAGVLYRDDSVGNLPTGVRIIDAAFAYCADNNISTFDLGGGYSYKQRWAPEQGNRYEIVLASDMRHQLHKMTNVLRHRTGSPGHAA